MLGLDLGDLAESVGYLGETLLLGGLGESRIEHIPLFVFALRRGQQVFGRRADASRGVCCRYGRLAAFEVFEETLRVLLLLLGRLGEYGRDLLVSLFFRHAREVSVPVARLTFAGERLEQVLLGQSAFDAFHDNVCYV